MSSLIKSLHHVTATVDDAQEDLDFYVKTLGTRLVKKTVNFDNHNVYHFYYGDERGTPNTLMTTFPYKGWGVPRGVHGAGQIIATSFSVPDGSLDSWRARLGERGYRVSDTGYRFDDEAIQVTDPSGLTIELVANGQDQRTPWLAQGLSEREAVRGIYGVSLAIRDPEPTIRFLQDVLGWAVVNEVEGTTRLAVNGDKPGHRLEVIHSPDAPPAVNGLGTVHHVAMAVESEEAQLEVRQRLVSLGVSVTKVMDRQYFKSIYFREPGGVLYEVATIPPGFEVDEDLSSLGSDLKLPPWEEPSRTAIEGGLATVSY